MISIQPKKRIKIAKLGAGSKVKPRWIVDEPAYFFDELRCVLQGKKGGGKEKVWGGYDNIKYIAH